MRIKYLFRVHRHYKERKKDGFSFFDLDDINGWFFDIFPRMIKAKLKKETNPKVKVILTELDEAFKETNILTCSFVNPYQEAFHEMMHKCYISHKNGEGDIELDNELLEKYHTESNKEDNYINAHKKEALMLLSKYIIYL